MYVKIIDNQVSAFPYSMATLRQDNPNTSFPAVVSEGSLSVYDVYKVYYQNNPSYEPKTHKVVPASTPVLVDSVWTITNSVVALTDEEIAENTATQSGVVRDLRNKLLTETDWTALSDNTMTTAMAEYRQALRDVTSQEGFPYDVTWPTKPE